MNAGLGSGDGSGDGSGSRNLCEIITPSSVCASIKIVPYAR